MQKKAEVTKGLREEMYEGLMSLEGVDKVITSYASSIGRGMLTKLKQYFS